MSNYLDDFDDVTKLVSSFYDQFPYYRGGYGDFLSDSCQWYWSLEKVHEVYSSVFPSLKRKFESIRILDAGCGTGITTNYLAHQNPGSEILAVDISGESIAIATNRLSSSRGKELCRVRFEQIDFMKIKNQEPFNYINSYGVFNHLKDPLEGFFALESLLHKGGIAHVFIPADSGRWLIRRAKEVFAMLELDCNNNGLYLAKQLLEDLPKGNKLRAKFEENFNHSFFSEEMFADMFLHPLETDFNLERLFCLIKQTSLTFLGFSNSGLWDISRLLKGDLLERAKQMSKEKRWRIIEKLDSEIGFYDFFLLKE